jgi:hypothetical protein
MPCFYKAPFQGIVQNIFNCEDSSASIVSHVIDRVDLSFEGFPGDTHSGLTRAACSRFPYLYKEGVEIRNSRQLTLISTEELAEIAAGLELDLLPAGWLGANIELSGIPSLTLLPPSSRLVFNNKATIVVDIENRPCVYPAKIIDSFHPGKGRKFIKTAKHKRGITAWVEREGLIEPGDSVEVFVPDQTRHPLLGV